MLDAEWKDKKILLSCTFLWLRLCSIWTFRSYHSSAVDDSELRRNFATKCILQGWPRLLTSADRLIAHESDEIIVIPQFKYLSKCSSYLWNKSWFCSGKMTFLCCSELQGYALKFPSQKVRNYLFSFFEFWIVKATAKWSTALSTT